MRKGSEGLLDFLFREKTTGTQKRGCGESKTSTPMLDEKVDHSSAHSPASDRAIDGLSDSNDLLLKGYNRLKDIAAQKSSSHSELPEIIKNLIQLCLHIQVDLTTDDLTNTEDVLATFAMMSFVSDQIDPANPFTQYNTPLELLKSCLETYNENEYLQAIEQQSEVFHKDLYGRLYGLQIEKSAGLLQKCWLDNWYEMTILKRSQLTGPMVFDDPLAVRTIVKYPQITTMPFLRGEDAKNRLKELKRHMQIGQRLSYVHPDNEMRIIPENFAIKQMTGSKYQGHLIFNIPLPVSILVNMPLVKDNEEKQLAWLKAFSAKTLWCLVTHLESNSQNIKLYQKQARHPYLVQSGVALGLLPQFLALTDTKESSFWQLLGNALQETSLPKVKRYWLGALVRMALGPQGVVIMACLGDHEEQIVEAYAILKGLLYSPSVMDLSVLNVYQCAKYLQEKVQETSAEVSFAPGRNDLWEGALDYDGDQAGTTLYRSWLVHNFPDVIPSSIQLNKDNPSEPGMASIFSYAQALESSAEAAMRYLFICASQQSEEKRELALKEFRKSFVKYQFFSLCTITNLKDIDGLERGELHNKSIAAAFEWHYQHLRSGEKFYTRQLKDLVIFLECLNYLLSCGHFGSEKNGLRTFAQYIVTHFKPVHKSDISDRSQISEVLEGFSSWFWMKYQQGTKLLVMGLRKRSDDLNISDDVVEEQDEKKYGGPCSDLIYYLSGYSPLEIENKNRHGTWLKALAFYLPVAASALWWLLRDPLSKNSDVLSTQHALRGYQPQVLTLANITTGGSMPKQLDLTASDVAFGVVIVLAILRLAENFACCEKITQNDWAHHTIAVAYIAAAITFLVWGNVLQNKNDEDINAAVLQVMANCIIFVMTAGAPLKLAKQVAEMFAFILASPFVMMYGVALACCKCHRPSKAAEVRLHMLQITRNFTFAAMLSACFVGASLTLPSFLANIVGNLPGNRSLEYGEDITFAGIVAAFLTPSAVFVVLLACSPQFKWFKLLERTCLKLLCCKDNGYKTRFTALDWLQLVLIAIVGTDFALLAWRESIFIQAQHANNEALIEPNSTAMMIKRDIDWSNVIVASICFFAFEIVRAYMSVATNPLLGSAEVSDKQLQCLERIGTCCKRAPEVRTPPAIVRPLLKARVGARQVRYGATITEGVIDDEQAVVNQRRTGSSCNIL